MIVTLTPNPSIDRTITVDRLLRGEVHRARESRIDPGGKGINVARALTAHGGPAVAVFPSGGPEGHLMEELLGLAGVPAAPCPVEGGLRMNVAVVEPDGTTTKLNEPGPTLSGLEQDALLGTARERTASDGPASTTWLVGCGSLPPGMPADTYAHVVAIGRELGVAVAVDSSGGPLALAVPAGPDLIKPNRVELAELLGRPLDRLGDVLEGAREVVASGVATVVVSLGRHGALGVTADEVAHAVAHVDRALSTVGAGDALLAGFLHARVSGGTLTDALTAGVAWGAAAVALPGSRMPGPGDTPGVHVTATTAPDLDLETTD